MKVRICTNGCQMAYFWCSHREHSMIRFGLISVVLGLVGCSDSTMSSTEKGLAVECGEGTVLVVTSLYKLPLY